ncbi:MAG: T9SS type A sorting domain-containing protein [Vicingaceae bacterium]
MRNLYSFCLLILLSSGSTLKADTNSDEISRALISLNAQWQDKALNIPTYAMKLNLENDVDLIQLHLDLVIKQLEKRELPQFSESQLEKRHALLNELTKYKKRGVFPQNLYHAQRTPYFIDDYGTACAVGYLIIQSGHADFTKTISEKYNYRYLSDMPQAEIQQWATIHGFTLDELEWIQPSYGPYCPTGTVRDPYCHNGTGCINPDYTADGLIPPYQFYIEYNDGSGWVEDSSQMLFFWGARVGQHRITVTDSLNTTLTYNYTINNPAPISINTTVLAQTDSSCNGSITVSASQGTAPYTYQLMRQNPPNYWTDSAGVFTGLCAGTYNLVIYDNNQCQQTASATVDNLTSIEEQSLVSVKLYPMPFHNRLKLKGAFTKSIQYDIYTLKGELVRSGQFTKQSSISTTDLESGAYILKLQDGNKAISKKIMKSN